MSLALAQQEEGRGERAELCHHLFYRLIIRTQACPALLVIVPKLTITSVAGTSFARISSCLNIPAGTLLQLELELESTKYFELNPPLVIAFFAP